MEQYLKIILEMKELTDINLCDLFMHTINSSHQLLMTVAVVVVIHFHKMRQHKH